MYGRADPDNRAGRAVRALELAADLFQSLSKKTTTGMDR
jgi:hypothetical protein